jgi:hypothetical protein
MNVFRFTRALKGRASRGRRWTALALAACAVATGAEAGPLYGPDSYIRAQSDGHFYRDGRRVRLWGENVQIESLRSYEEINNFVARIQALGYNGVRLWPSQASFNDSNFPRKFPQPSPMDGSDLDRFDYAVAKLKAAGISIQMTALHNVGTSTLQNEASPEVQQWARETREKFPSKETARNKVWAIAAYLSDDWLQMRLQRQRAFLQHRNPHSGRTYAAESSVSTWELENESHFVECAMSSECVTKELPPIAVTSLAGKWLASAYNPGGAIKFDIGDLLANHYEAYARFIVDRFKTASDIQAAAARGLGPGVRVQPFLYNTGLQSPNALAHFAYSLGDVASMDGYRSPMAPVATGPKSGYENSPWVPISTGGPVPTFMTGFRVQGKALVIYETSFFRPYHYRAEWGPAMAAWALRQDWDAVYLYAQGHGKTVYGEASPGVNNNGANSFYGTVMLPERVYADCGPGSAYTEGFQHGGDPAVQMGWALGGRLLQSVSESPAVAAVWNIRDKVLYSPANRGYPQHFVNELRTAYEKTVAVRFVGTGAAACSNADIDACTPSLPPRAPSTFSVTVLPTTARPLKITTPAGTVIAGHLPAGDLGQLSPTPVRASMPAAGFGVVAGLKSDLAGTGSATSTLIALRDVHNTGYDFREDDVQLAVPFGAECGVKSAGSAPLLWTGPGVTFTSATPLTFSPYDFRFMKGSSTRGNAYAPPVAATGPEGAAWVDARP